MWFMVVVPCKQDYGKWVVEVAASSTCEYFNLDWIAMELIWTLAHPLRDVEDIIAIAQQNLDIEGSCLKIDVSVFRKNVTVTSTYQLFDRSREFLAICRNEHNDALGYCWFDRGGYTTYSNEEIGNAKFHHVDLNLPVRTRVRIINQMIDQNILWCKQYNIPIICSTSIRGEYDGFMKIHKKRGFTVHGSYAWIRTEKAIV